MKTIIAATMALGLSLPFTHASLVKEYRQGDVWVRTVLHEDGSRTVSMKDDRVKEVIKETYSPQDVLVSKSRFEVNAKGDYVRGQVFDRQGNLAFVSEFVYDQFDRLLEERVTTARGVPVRRLIYRYDQFGKARPFAISFEDGRAVGGPQAIDDASRYSTSSDHGFRVNPEAAAETRAAQEEKEDDERSRFRLFNRNKDSSDSDSGERKGLFRRRK